MAMTAPVEDNLTFSCPVIAPKTYIVKGPSGWTETFKRDVLDRELAVFLSPAPIDDMVGLFITARELSDNKDPTSWYTVVGFLGRTLGVSPRGIPPTVGIAFWGHVVLATINKAVN